MFTPYRRPDAPDVPAPLFDPAATLLVDPLTGVVPTWRLDEEPIYLEVIRDLGVPGLADPAGPVVVGDLLTSSGDEHPIGVVDEPSDPVENHATPDDAPPTRALRLAPAPAVDECPDCGALDPEPCRPKSDPVHGRPLTRQHRRRRAHVQRDQGARIKRSEGGRADFVLVLLVLLLVVTVATGVGTFLAGAVDSVRGPWDVRPCNGTTVCDPTPEPAP